MMRIIFAICLILLLQLTSAAPVCANDAVTGSFTTGDFTPPSRVLDLSANSATPYSVTLLWTAPGDDGDVGKASAYDIRYSISPITTEKKWLNSNRVLTGIPAPKPAGSNQTCTVSGLLPNTTYYFALKAVDDYSNWSSLSNCASVITPAEYKPTTTTPVIQPTQTTLAPTSEEEGPIYINIKGKRGVIFLGLRPDGTLARTTIINLNDSHLEMTILKSTILLDKDGQPVSVIVLEYVEPYVPAPSGFYFQATYNFQPYCVIEPSIQIKMHYTLQGLAPDVNETGIHIASYNQNQDSWITLSTTRDIIHQFAGTDITYFALFSLLVPGAGTPGGTAIITPSSNLSVKNLKLSSSVIKPGDTLIISADVINSGAVEGEFYLPLILDGTVLDSRNVVLAAQQAEKVTFNLVIQEEGIHTVGIGPLSAIVNVKQATASAVGFFSKIRTPLIWSSIIGLALVCIITLINLWRKGKTSPRRL